MGTKQKNNWRFIVIMAATLILVVENALLIVKPMVPYDQRFFFMAGLAVALVAFLVAIAALRRYVYEGRIAGEEKPAVAVAAPPKTVVDTDNHQAVLLLSLLQEKGRFVDFLMEDIAAYSNEQVGAAARVVHQGCREIIKDTFAPTPVSQQPEKSEVTLDQGFDSAAYRLVGNVGGSPPYKGTLVHPGWRASRVNLPRPAHIPEDQETPVILPAEVKVERP